MPIVVSLGALVGCGQEFYRPNPPPEMKIVSAIRAGGGDKSAASEGDAAVESAGTGWGALKGQFVLDGDLPDLPGLATGKDVEVCGNQSPNQSLVVDSGTKGIANIVIYARKVPRVFKPDGGEATPVEQVFDQKGCVFLTHVLAMQVRDPLHIKNSDPISHNSKLEPPGNPGINPNLPANGDATYQFKKQLPLPTDIVCSIHPWMKAYIIARDDSYFAVTKPDGTFEIANLPAGDEIEFQVWHERAGKGLAAQPDWKGGRFKVTIPADGAADLGQIKVPVSALQ